MSRGHPIWTTNKFHLAVEASRHAPHAVVHTVAIRILWPGSARAPPMESLRTLFSPLGTTVRKLLTPAPIRGNGNIAGHVRLVAHGPGQWVAKPFLDELVHRRKRRARTRQRRAPLRPGALGGNSASLGAPSCPPDEGELGGNAARNGRRIRLEKGRGAGAASSAAGTGRGCRRRRTHGSRRWRDSGGSAFAAGSGCPRAGLPKATPCGRILDVARHGESRPWRTAGTIRPSRLNCVPKMRWAARIPRATPTPIRTGDPGGGGMPPRYHRYEPCNWSACSGDSRPLSRRPISRAAESSGPALSFRPRVNISPEPSAACAPI